MHTKTLGNPRSYEPSPLVLMFAALSFHEPPREGNIVDYLGLQARRGACIEEQPARPEYHSVARPNELS